MRHRIVGGATMSGAWQRRPRRPGLRSRAGTRARVVIVGAGFGGLECARKLNRAEVDVLLVQSAGRLLTGFSARLGRYAERTLTSRGVEVRLKTGGRAL